MEPVMIASLPWYVAVGASGSQGLRDILDLLSCMPTRCNAVFLVVLHRPSDGRSDLLNVLRTHVPLPVRIAAEAEALAAGTCYIGEPAELLTLAAQGHAAMVNGEDNVFRNRTVDLLFDSVGNFAGGKAIGIVLSGALDDGSRGLATIHRAGGMTMVLDPDGTARGMQQNAIDFNRPVDFVGSCGEIAAAIRKKIGA